MRHPQVAAICALIEDQIQALLRHPYFDACRSGDIDHLKLIEIVKQLYCLSTFFERILTRRIARFSSHTPLHFVRTARAHLREEIGHPEMFRECLLANGVSEAEMAAIAPTALTKALFGYLLATIEYESDEVSSVAIFQVMEGAAFHFFSATLELMRRHGCQLDAFVEHAHHDADHANLGLEEVARFDERTLADSRRVIRDLFQLMYATLDDWMARC